MSLGIFHLFGIAPGAMSGKWCNRKSRESGLNMEEEPKVLLKLAVAVNERWIVLNGV